MPSNAAPLEPAKPVRLADEIQVQKGAVVSRAFVQKPVGSLTLFAFDGGQGLSEHSAPYDAFVTVLEGEVELVIGGRIVVAAAGETVLMPANVPHALNAREPMKMLLAMIRG